MSRIPRHIVDAVREHTDIVEVISRHVRLERRGNSWLGLCPFHQEKTPSFNVVPQKQMYYCFGCQAGGDVFRFLMQVQGLSFVEAVKELASPAGIEVPERELSQDEARALRERATLYDVLEEACRFYESVLWTRPEGEPGRAYLERRGLTHETVKKARIGFAPAGWSSLLDHLRKQGFDPGLAAEVGLSRQRQGGGQYDAFRERVLFPIRDERGRVIAFGGRLLEGDGPKYINTPETRLYQKSNVLYGLEMALRAIQQKDRVLVVEGYFDVVSLHQAGFEEAVATCGTALTPEHLEKIRRLTGNVVILLDADEAGSRAAEKVLPMFMAAGLQPWRLQLPGAKDPDELIREEGPEAMEAALDRKEPLLDWAIARRLDARGHNAIGRQRTLEDLAPLLRQFPQAVLSDVAARLHMMEEQVLQAVRAAPAPQGDNAPEREEPQRSVWRPHRDAVRLLWLLVHRYDQVADIMHRLDDPSILDAHAPIQEVAARLASGEPVAAITDEVVDPMVRKALQAVVARTDELYTVASAAIGLCEVLDRLATPRREQRILDLSREIEDALRAGDTAAHRRAATERQQLTSIKNELARAFRRGDVQRCQELLEAEVRTISCRETS